MTESRKRFRIVDMRALVERKRLRFPPYVVFDADYSGNLGFFHTPAEAEMISGMTMFQSIRRVI